MIWKVYLSQFCDQLINLSKYHSQLYKYIRNRMKMMTPNLTALVGGLIGAKLPASTIQILGAEKSFFRAVKAKKTYTKKWNFIPCKPCWSSICQEQRKDC